MVAMENKAPKKIKFNYARIVTAFLIVVAVLGAIALGGKYVAILFIVVNVLGARELCFVLDKDKSPIQNLIYVVLGLAPFGLVWFLDLGFGSTYFYLLLLSCAIMLGLIVNLWFGKLNYYKIRYPFALLYWGLPFSLASYFLIYGDQPRDIILMSIIILIWTSDTMAYFTGKAFGKNKLFPSVSPGKTIEGSMGAGVFSILVALGFAYALGESFGKWIIVAVAIWVLGTLGDLVESRLKRVQNVKDSGSILPGHGGFLDRFDSLVLLIPFLLLLEYCLGA